MDAWAEHALSVAFATGIEPTAGHVVLLRR